MKLAQGLSHGDSLKLAKRLDIALDSGSGAPSSKDIEKSIGNDDNEDVGELSMTFGFFFWRALGKKVDQSCPDFQFFDPSLLPGAVVSTSVEPRLGSRPLFFLTRVRRWKAGIRESPSRCDPCAVSGRGQCVLKCENNLVCCTMVLPCWSLLAQWSENNPGFDVSEFLAGAGEPSWLVPKPLTWMVRPSLCWAARADGGQRGQLVEESDSFSACFQTCMSPIDCHRLVSDVVDGRCTLHAHGSTNIHVLGYMLIQGVRVRTGIHVVKFLGKQRLRVRVL